MNAPQPQYPPPMKPRQPVLRKLPRKTANPAWRWLGFLFGLTGVAMLSATAGALLAMTLSSTPLMQRKLSSLDATVFKSGGIASRNTLQFPELTRPVNILVMGVKVLTSDVENPPAELSKLPYQALVNSFEGLTDTMLLIRFNPEIQKVVVMSIPRDTKTEIPGYGVTKINAANAYGGPALTAQTVSQLLDGVGIDRYVTINVQGVQALIDALGGVTVYVPKDMKYQDNSQHLYINLKAGKQHLNGSQALQLLRFRYDQYGDIGRIQRQQMVMRALMEQALNPMTLARLPQILSVIQSHVDTNLSVEELVALVGYAARTQRSNVQMLMVPGDFNSPGEHETSYWLPNYDQISQMMAKYFDLGFANSSAHSPGSIQIMIQDSTGRRQATQSLVDRLAHAGYGNVAISDPYTEPLTVTRIVAQQGDAESAEALRQQLGFGEVRIESTGDLGSDITIQLGRDWFQHQGKPTPTNAP